MTPRDLQRREFYSTRWRYALNVLADEPPCPHRELTPSERRSIHLLEMADFSALARVEARNQVSNAYGGHVSRLFPPRIEE